MLYVGLVSNRLLIPLFQGLLQSTKQETKSSKFLNIPANFVGDPHIER